MKILTQLDSEWHDRTIELCNSTSVGDLLCGVVNVTKELTLERRNLLELK